MRRGTVFKLKDSKFTSHMRKTFFRISVVKHWARFPKDMIGVSSLETFKDKLDWALSNLS